METNTHTKQYQAVPALPAEQQDPRINPSGGPLGWLVMRTIDEEIVRGTMFMECAEAERIAAEMNAAFVSTLPTHQELVRKGARYCKHCGTDEAMPGHEC